VFDNYLKHNFITLVPRNNLGLLNIMKNYQMSGQYKIFIKNTFVRFAA
jgi:hypothetical protein